MIGTSSEIEAGQALECEICIVGAGAAGVTLALELAKHGREVILLEAGGLKHDRRVQRLYAGTVASPAVHLPPDTDRARRLGGTTSLWGGRCIPLDPIDLEKRDYVPLSGWPISYDELTSNYERAHVYCQCGSTDYDATTALPDGTRPMIPGLDDDDLITSSLERWSPPTDFGKVYRNALRSSRCVHVLLNSVCLELECGESGRTVGKLHVSTPEGKRFAVRAQTTVLCGGGLEVTRLLLVSDGIHREGLGNETGWLGRGYMCHVRGVIARLQLNAGTPIIFGYERDADGVYCRRRFSIAAPAQRRDRLLNINMMLDRSLIGDPAHRSGMLSLAFMAKSLLGKSQEIVSGGTKSYFYLRHLANILSGSPEILSVLPGWFRARFVAGRRIPSILPVSKENNYHLYYQSEQIPNSDSRVVLSDTRDELGVPRLHIDFRITEQDCDSIFRAHELMNRALRSSGIGRITYTSEHPREDIYLHQAVLGHHLGTTRMAHNPRCGVVDENCRVHGIDNLFIASGAVFPTSGQANPTLSIVALAIRLADHLQRRSVDKRGSFSSCGKNGEIQTT